ncbi:MAG: hypothetical protein AAGC86_01960 [Pseudomonadota bacterium]
MFRLQRSGGRLSIAVCHNITESPAHPNVAILLDADASNAAGDAMRASYRLDDRDEIVAVHAAASFSKFTTRTLAEEVRIPDTRTMVEADLREWLPRYGIHLSQEDIARTLAAPDVVLASYAAGFGLAEC